MKGVQFTRPMPPSHGTGDTRLFPDEVADALIESGEATAYAFPDQPLAHDAYQAPSTKPIDATLPARRPTLTIRKK